MDLREDQGVNHLGGLAELRDGDTQRDQREGAEAMDGSDDMKNSAPDQIEITARQPGSNPLPLLDHHRRRRLHAGSLDTQSPRGQLPRVSDHFTSLHFERTSMRAGASEW